MTASYPSAVRTWTTKLGWKHILWAAHVNDLQTEIDATQRTMGLNPHISRNNPGGLTRNYETVQQRMTAHARGDAIPYYRAQVINYTPAAGSWVDVPIAQVSVGAGGGAAVKVDPFLLASGGSVRLNTHGIWHIEARAEWQATGYTLANSARRYLRILLNGADVGLSDVTTEDARNSFALHNQVVWPEALARGTQITVQVKTDVEQPPTTTPPPATDTDTGKVWCHRGGRWKLLRCWNGSAWEPFTGHQSTSISSATPPSSPSNGRLWIDTSGPVGTPKVFRSGAWQIFTGLDEDIATLLDAESAPTSPTSGRVWVDTRATADIVNAWIGGKWQRQAARNCRDGDNNEVPAPPPTTPTTPDYGLAVNVDLRLYLARTLDEVKPAGAIVSPLSLAA